MTELQVVELLTWLRGLCPLMSEQQEEFIQHELLPMDVATARAGIDRYIRRPNPNPRFEAYDKVRLTDLLADLRHETERRKPSRYFGGPFVRAQASPPPGVGELIAAGVSTEAAEFLGRHQARKPSGRPALPAAALEAIEKSSAALQAIANRIENQRAHASSRERRAGSENGAGKCANS